MPLVPTMIEPLCVEPDARLLAVLAVALYAFVLTAFPACTRRATFVDQLLGRVDELAVLLALVPVDLHRRHVAAGRELVRRPCAQAG